MEILVNDLPPFDANRSEAVSHRSDRSGRAEMFLIKGYRAFNQLDPSITDKGMRLTRVAETFDRFPQRRQATTKILRPFRRDQPVALSVVDADRGLNSIQVVDR